MRFRSSWLGPQQAWEGVFQPQMWGTPWDIRRRCWSPDTVVQAGLCASAPGRLVHPRWLLGAPAHSPLSTLLVESRMPTAGETPGLCGRWADQIRIRWTLEKWGHSGQLF